MPPTVISSPSQQAAVRVTRPRRICHCCWSTCRIESSCGRMLVPNLLLSCPLRATPTTIHNLQFSASMSCKRSGNLAADCLTRCSQRIVVQMRVALRGRAAGMAKMGATHFLMKRLRNVRTEMALSVLAYNPGSEPAPDAIGGPGQALTRVMNIIGIRPLIAAIRA